MYRHIAANALTLLIMTVIAVGVVIGWGQNEFSKPGPLEGDTLVVVEQRANLARAKRIGKRGRDFPSDSVSDGCEIHGSG